MAFEDDPIINGQITRVELDRCEADPTPQIAEFKPPFQPHQGPRIPVCRSDKPSHVGQASPELKDSQIIRLNGTTKETIAKIRARTLEYC